MWFYVVGHLVAHARPEGEDATILQLGAQLALDTKEDMALVTPVVRHVPGSVLDHPNAYITELLGAPVGDTALTFVLATLHLRPVRSTERDTGDVHNLLPLTFHSHCHFVADVPSELSRDNDPIL